jgi:hypothetical protein
MFERLLGLQPVFTCSPEEYQCHKGAKINYSSTALDKDEIQVFPYGILEEKGIKQDPDIDRLFESTTSFSLTVREKLVIGSHSLRIEQDIFSAAFYLLARYEEYLPFDADHHNRFSSGLSVAFRHGFLRKPIIQEWAVALGDALLFFFPDLVLSGAKFQQVITIDIDQAFKYRNKSFLRTLGGLLLNPRTFAERFRVLLRTEKDPFDSFDEMIQLFEDRKEKVLFFVLIGDIGAYDKNIDSRNVEFQNIINLFLNFPTGIFFCRRIPLFQNQHVSLFHIKIRQA